MLKEAYEANKKAKEFKAEYEELREAIVDAVKGLDDKTLVEGDYVAKVKYVENVEYIDIERAQKVLPAECFKVVVDKDVVKALEKAGKINSGLVDKFRKFSYTVPRVVIDKK